MGEREDLLGEQVCGGRGFVGRRLSIRRYTQGGWRDKGVMKAYTLNGSGRVTTYESNKCVEGTQ